MENKENKEKITQIHFIGVETWKKGKNYMRKGKSLPQFVSVEEKYVEREKNW